MDVAMAGFVQARPWPSWRSRGQSAASQDVSERIKAAEGDPRRTESVLKKAPEYAEDRAGTFHGVSIFLSEWMGRGFGP